eukprot:maker-scaffold198_size266703-snap-gene-0.21 protein:Tk12338 transcript:maker-scaffold198_size266703-snap-gene-0.21-mRNA-1 annotation:"tubulin-specific chaperone d"
MGTLGPAGTPPLASGAPTASQPASTEPEDPYTNAVGLGCALETFQEAQAVEAWIEGVEAAANQANRLPWEWLYQKFTLALDLYQEQPHLIDPFFPQWIRRLLILIRENPGQPEAGSLGTRHAAAALAAHIIKVRKDKVAVRQFPHEVSDVEPVLALLEAEHGLERWETVYVLLLWLSMLVLIPFDMGRFDSGAEVVSLRRRIDAVTRQYLVATVRAQNAAAMLASKFFTRPEIALELLEPFLDWCLSVASDPAQPDVARMGALKALAAVYKQGQRAELLRFTPQLLARIIALELKDHPNALLRQLSLKVIQRCGLIFLPARVAAWRYQRGNRSLVVNLLAELAPAAGSEPGGQNMDLAGEDADADYDIPDDIEEVIEELLSGLRDKDTVIRWSAAKGIGRITNRLPRELADDVVESLLGLFSLRESDAAWHGGCLALAELGRRGLLLPERLDAVVRVVLKALVYDEKKGSFSVGSHIRDAACYVCWAFARAYDPDALRPHVDEIACALLTVTIFDREVNCRRAASAAFQENVGRQGTFPFGIDILTQADYYAVGSRNNTYLDLSVFVAQFGDYNVALIDHLIEKKVNHWDLTIRDLTADALHNLSHVNRDLMKSKVLPKLLHLAQGSDLFGKHGAIVAIGTVCLALSKAIEKEGSDLGQYLGPDMVSAIKTIAPALVEKLSLRMTGGDLLRQAITSYISNCSLAKFPIHHDDTVHLWHAILAENLSNSDPLIQEKAIKAVPHFLGEYLKDPKTSTLLVGKRDKIFDEYLHELGNSELHRRGFSLALGACPEFVLKGREGDILEKLFQCIPITPDTETWAEARRDAILALTSIAQTLGYGPDGLASSTVVQLYQCLLGGFQDYTLDRRGDIGAWVREAAMGSLCSITLDLMDKSPELVPEICVRELMPSLAQQAVEKIDRTRGLATRLFTTLLLHEQTVPGIPRHQELKSFFPPNLDMTTFPWTVESQTFPIFTRLLNLEEYTERVLVGLVVSVGGLTERLVKYASLALFQEVDDMSLAQKQHFCRAMLRVLRANQKNDRVTLPFMKFLDQLLTSGHLEDILENENSAFSMDLLGLVKAEIAKSGDPQKLMLSCDVICALLQTHDSLAVKKALVQLSIFLCHKFPRIRKLTANKLFEALLTFSDRSIVPEENFDAVNAILSDTDWDKSIEILRPMRNNLCDLMGVPAPAIIKKPAPATMLSMSKDTDFCFFQNLAELWCSLGYTSNLSSEMPRVTSVLEWSLVLIWMSWYSRYTESSRSLSWWRIVPPDSWSCFRRLWARMMQNSLVTRELTWTSSSKGSPGASFFSTMYLKLNLL